MVRFEHRLHVTFEFFLVQLFQNIVIQRKTWLFVNVLAELKVETVLVRIHLVCVIIEGNEEANCFRGWRIQLFSSFNCMLIALPFATTSKAQQYKCMKWIQQ
jgi:hypothetical protein